MNRRETHRQSWQGRLRRFGVGALLLAALGVSQSSCGRDAFVVVKLNGLAESVQSLSVSLKVGKIASILGYSQREEEVSFFLPDEALGSTLNITIYAFVGSCLQATGSTDVQVENHPRLDAQITFAPTGSCP